MLSIECPHCGLIKQMPAEQLPDHEIELQCPKCTNTFEFDPIVANLVAAENSPSQSPEVRPAGLQSPVERSATLATKRPQRTEMLRIGELFSRSWGSFKERVWTLLGIYLLGTLLIIGTALLIQAGSSLLIQLFAGSLAAQVLGMLVVASFICLAVTWIAAASIYAIVDKTGVRKSLGLGGKRIWAYLWLFSLLSLIIGGGYGLLIIPGILFTVWFFFAQYVLAAEDTRGMDALLKSKQYVRGHGWAVFGRLLLLMLIFLPLGFIPLVGPFLSFLLGPFSLVYYNEIYQDLRELKPALPALGGNGLKAVFIGLGIAGLLLIPLGTYFGAGPEARQAVALLAGMATEEFAFQPDDGSTENRLQIESQHGSASSRQQVTAKNPLDDLMVYVYALNYTGQINLNGKDFYTIKGDPDRNYNYSTGGALDYGKNVFRVDYSALPDPWKLELRIKIYKPNWQTGGRTIYKEWLLEDSGGSKTFEIEIRPEQLEKT